MTDGVLCVVDVQHVFADPGSPWGAPRFAEVHPAIRRLTAAFAGRVVHTRFVAPAEPTGAWVPYYAQFPFALQPPDAPLYALLDDPGDAPVLDATDVRQVGAGAGRARRRRAAGPRRGLHRLLRAVHRAARRRRRGAGARGRRRLRRGQRRRPRPGARRDGASTPR